MNRPKNAEDWIAQLLALGKHSFSLQKFRSEFPEHTETALKFALKRLVDKQQIVSIHRGFYLILPPQFRSKGVLPPSMFLDDLMQDLKRDYYLALLNAAAFHGASHQQPQEFFVVTEFPVLRTMKKKGLTVNFICKREIPVGLLDIRKTETGYLKISNAALTATDLVQYAKHVGGINRVATILNELASQLNARDFDELLLQHVPVSVLQRLGYLLDNVVDRPLLASALFRAMQSSEMELFRTPLTNASTIQGFSSDEKWKVIVNTEIEMDE